jgi:hypothetical protein
LTKLHFGRKIFRTNFNPRANPTIATYNATGSLVRFVNKNAFFLLKTRSGLLQRRRCNCKFRSSRVTVKVSPKPYRLKSV